MQCTGTAEMKRKPNPPIPLREYELEVTATFKIRVNAYSRPEAMAQLYASGTEISGCRLLNDDALNEKSSDGDLRVSKLRSRSRELGKCALCDSSWDNLSESCYSAKDCELRDH